jgi:hypothetical protein
MIKLVSSAYRKAIARSQTMARGADHRVAGSCSLKNVISDGIGKQCSFAGKVLLETEQMGLPRYTTKFVCNTARSLDRQNVSLRFENSVRVHRGPAPTQQPSVG